MGMSMPLPKEAKDALEQTKEMADDIKAIRVALERLVELEEARAAKEQG